MTFLLRGLLPLAAGLALAAPAAHAQATRVVDQNALGWFTYTGDHPLSRRWTLHTEAQVRRVELGGHPQQLLLRLGGVYALPQGVKLGGGYTNFTTYTYGRHPIAALGQPTPEHRAYEDITLPGGAYGRLTLTHRLRLEQRWLGQLDHARPTEVAGWEYQNRIRYQLAGQVPLQGPKLDDGEFYFTFYDELFIGFGPNVGYNVFNQNRISGGLGYQITDDFRLDLSYLNQWVQHPSPLAATGQPIFENNNGFRFNVVYNLHFAKSQSD